MMLIIISIYDVDIWLRPQRRVPKNKLLIIILLIKLLQKILINDKRIIKNNKNNKRTVVRETTKKDNIYDENMRIIKFKIVLIVIKMKNGSFWIFGCVRYCSLHTVLCV
jgi:hypothetical protein